MHRDDHARFHFVPERDSLIQIKGLRRPARWKDKNIDTADCFQRIIIQHVTQICTMTDPDAVQRETKNIVRPPLSAGDLIVVRGDS